MNTLEKFETIAGGRTKVQNAKHDIPAGWRIVASFVQNETAIEEEPDNREGAHSWSTRRVARVTDVRYFVLEQDESSALSTLEKEKENAGMRWLEADAKARTAEASLKKSEELVATLRADLDRAVSKSAIANKMERHLAALKRDVGVERFDRVVSESDTDHDDHPF